MLVRTDRFRWSSWFITSPYVPSWRDLRHWDEACLLFTQSIPEREPARVRAPYPPSRMDELVRAHARPFSLGSCGELELVATITACAISVHCSVSNCTTYCTLIAIARGASRMLRLHSICGSFAASHTA